MQYKKSELGIVEPQRAKVTGSEIAFKILFSTMIFAILVTYFTK
ncbi:MAG TPA: hypothetical protein VF412_08510 [Bdellovibrio sp.]